MNASHLPELRRELVQQQLHGFLVPRADEHLGEYVPAGAERLAWLTGFTGSAGLAVVLPDRAAIFTDGRYILQAAAETDPELWERRHITDEPPPGWIVAHVPPGACIGYDPLLISEEALQRFRDSGLTMVGTSRNPVDAIWHDRPGPPMAPVLPHPEQFTGRTSDGKRDEIAEALRAARQDAAVLTDPASIAWLLNIRGNDVPFTPFALGFAIVHADGACQLFMAAEKLPQATRAWIGNGVSAQDRSALPGALTALKAKRVRVDPAGSPAWFAETLRAAGAEVVAGPDPCTLPKACKNEVEQQGARNAQLRDAAAVCSFLCWLTTAAGRETELSASARLAALRERVELFRGLSFPAISGAGEHAAIMHYHVSAETDRPIRHDEIYLIDSGGQYSDGTTDVTRTVWTGPATPPALLRDRFTRVLKGHIAVATLVFPHGLVGSNIDVFARRALWNQGLDFDHGTGHGVGSYLSVHEGPVSLSRLARPVPLAPGMLLSNEPGFYLPGEYGIRLENLVLVQPAELAAATKPFLRFETLTLAPFDKRLILPALLTADEVEWLDAYHARVLSEIGPRLDHPAREWLAEACAKLVAD